MGARREGNLDSLLGTPRLLGSLLLDSRLMVFVVYGDFQRPKKLLVLRRQLDLAVRFEAALRLRFWLDLSFFIRIFTLVEADSGFEHEEDVIARALNLSNRGGNAIGVGKRLVDGVSQLLHQIL